VTAMSHSPLSLIKIKIKIKIKRNIKSRKIDKRKKKNVSVQSVP